MGKTNIGYHRFYPEGGEGSGSGDSGSVYAVTSSEEAGWALVESGTTNPVTYNMIMNAFTEGKLVYYYEIWYEIDGGDVPHMFAGYLTGSYNDGETYAVNFMSSNGLALDATVNVISASATAPDSQLAFNNGNNDDNNNNDNNNT